MSCTGPGGSSASGWWSDGGPGLGLGVVVIFTHIAIGMGAGLVLGKWVGLE